MKNLDTVAFCLAVAWVLTSFASCAETEIESKTEIEIRRLEIEELNK